MVKAIHGLIVILECGLNMASDNEEGFLPGLVNRNIGQASVSQHTVDVGIITLKYRHDSFQLISVFFCLLFQCFSSLLYHKFEWNKPKYHDLLHFFSVFHQEFIPMSGNMQQSSINHDDMRGGHVSSNVTWYVRPGKKRDLAFHAENPGFRVQSRFKK